MPNQHEPWRPEEIDFLVANPDLSHAEVGRQLGRSAPSVQTKRSKLRRAGVPIQPIRNPKPAEMGRRLLVAKTCVACGLLLDAEWYRFRADGRRESRCRACHSERTAQWNPSLPRREQNGTRDAANRTGSEWTDEELRFVAESDLPVQEIALRLGRTWSAVTNVRFRSGLADRNPRLPERTETWRIARP